MNKNRNDLKVKISLIIFAIIFGSGFLIWGYHFLFEGKNLRQPPNFDLSEYGKLDWVSPKDLKNNFEALFKKETNSDNEIDPQIIESLTEKVQQKISQKNYYQVYFAKDFLSVTADETKQGIIDFAQKYLSLSEREYEYEDFLAQQCYDFEFKNQVTSQDLFLLQTNSSAQIFFTDEEEQSGQICFDAPVYYFDAFKLLSENNAQIVDLPRQTPDFVAVVILKDENEIQKNLEKMFQENDNLVKIEN